MYNAINIMIIIIQNKKTKNKKKQKTKKNKKNTQYNKLKTNYNNYQFLDVVAGPSCGCS